MPGIQGLGAWGDGRAGGCMNLPLRPADLESRGSWLHILITRQRQIQYVIGIDIRTRLSPWFANLRYVKRVS